MQYFSLKQVIIDINVATLMQRYGVSVMYQEFKVRVKSQHILCDLIVLCEVQRCDRESLVSLSSRKGDYKRRGTARVHVHITQHTITSNNFKVCKLKVRIKKYD